MKNIHALVIIAHPDDEAFLMAGTTLKFAHEGKRVALICATCGEKGDSRLEKALNKKQLSKVRSEELRKSAKILKAEFVIFLNYPDGQLSEINFDQLTRKLTKLIKQHQPSVIITFGKEGISGHKDHITIGKAAVLAAKKSAVRPLQIWRASMPASFMKIFNQYLFRIRIHHSHFHPKPLKGVSDRKLLKIPIKKFRNKKLQALFCHKSQGLPPWMIHSFPKVREQFLSYEYFEITRLRP